MARAGGRLRVRSARFILPQNKSFVMRHLLAILLLFALLGLVGYKLHADQAAQLQNENEGLRSAEVHAASKADEASTRAEQLSKDLADSRARERSLSDQLKASDAERDKCKAALSILESGYKLKLMAADKKAADLEFKLEHQTCPAPDYSKYEKRIAELEAQLKPKAAAPVVFHEWLEDTADAETQSKSLNRPILVDFERCTFDRSGRVVNDCVPCQAFKDNVLGDDRVADRVCREFVPLWHRTTGHDALSDKCEVDYFPTVAIIYPDGTWVSFNPERTPEGFMRQLDKHSKATP